MWHYINKNISIQLYIHYILSMILPSPCLNEAGCLALKLHNSSDPALACWARLIQPKTSMYLKPLWMFSTTLLKFYRANIPGVRQWCFFWFKATETSITQITTLTLRMSIHVRQSTSPSGSQLGAWHHPPARPPVWWVRNSLNQICFTELITSCTPIKANHILSHSWCKVSHCVNASTVIEWKCMTWDCS